MNKKYKSEKMSKKRVNNSAKVDPLKKIAMLKINPTRLRKIMEKGFTEEELADLLGIEVSTFNLWKRNKDFGKLLREAKEFANDWVETSLFKNAVGFTKTDKIYKRVLNKKTGKERIVLVSKTVKEIAGDVEAQITWLTNRRKNKWKRYNSQQELKSANTNSTIKFDPLNFSIN